MFFIGGNTAFINCKIVKFVIIIGKNGKNSCLNEKKMCSCINNILTHIRYHVIVIKN